ncbi:MAG: flagellar export chaperone FliS [Sphingobium sp.]
MFYGQGYAGNASKRYAAIHAGSRIEAATPHMLVKILFDELLLAIDAAMLAQSAGDMAKTNDKHARAMSILHALESSLDFDKGGEIAKSLAVIYRESRRLLLLAAQNKTTVEARKAHDILSEIADAWGKIA